MYHESPERSGRCADDSVEGSCPLSRLDSAFCQIRSPTRSLLRLPCSSMSLLLPTRRCGVLEVLVNHTKCKAQIIAILQAASKRRSRLLDHTRPACILSLSRPPSCVGSLLRWVLQSALRHRHHRLAVVAGSTENREYRDSHVP